MSQKNFQAASLARAARPVIEALESRTLLSASALPAVADSALAYDAAGKLHVAYYDGADKSLKYAARLANGRWADGGVIDAGSADVGAMPSLALAPDGNPAAAYYDAQNGDLKYARWTGSAWDVQSVDTRGATGLYPSLAFDAAGSPVIASYDATRDDLRLSTLYDGAWHSFTLDAEGDVGRHPSLAVDPTSGVWSVAYEATGAGELRFAAASRAGKIYGTVIDPAALGTSVSLGFGAEGINTPRRPRVAYDDAATGEVRVASGEADGWQTRAVASGGAGGAALSIDASDSAKLVYRDGAGTLALAERSGRKGAWSATPLGAGGGVSAAAFSSAGDVAVTQPGANPAAATAPAVGERFAAAPSRVTVTHVDASTLRVDWLDNTVGESGFNIESSADGGRTWQQAAVAGRNATATNVGGLTEGKTYAFRASAIGGSATSATASANTAAAPASSGTDPLDTPGWFRINGIAAAGAERTYGVEDHLAVDSTNWFYAASWAGAVYQAVTGHEHVINTNMDYYVPDNGAFRVGYSAAIKRETEGPATQLPDDEALKVIAFEDSYGAIDRDFDDKYWNVSVEKVDIDLDAMKVSHNVANGELPDEEEETVGAFVPNNYDDDDYNGTLDGFDSNAVTGEDDLLPILLHKVNAADAGNYRLTIPYGVNVWRTSDRTGAISETTDIAAGVDTTLYVEGSIPSAGELKLNWKNSSSTITDADRVKVTVYEMTGPLNVPNYSAYEYKATGALPTSGWTGVSGGVISAGANTSDAKILWDTATATVGRPSYKVNDNYIWDMEVNVVQVELDPSVNVIAYSSSPPAQLVGDGRLIASTADGSAAVRTALQVDLVGPVVNGGIRGLKYIQVGYIQNVTTNSTHADFDAFTPKKRVVSSLEGSGPMVDFVTNPVRSVNPWYDINNSVNTTYESPQSDVAQVIGVLMNFIDVPVVQATDRMRLYQGVFYEDVDYFSVRLDFNIYLAVHTTDSTNGADEVYAQRARADWHFDGTGNFVAGPGVWSPVGAENGGDASFTEVKNGDVVPVTDGVPANDYLPGETWSVVNQP